MMRLQKITALALAAALAVSLAACGGAADSAPAASAAPAASEAAGEAAPAPVEEENAAETAYPLTLTDQAGREVTIESEPETLVSGYYISTSLLIALGLEDQLAGIEAKADTRPIYARSAPELLELPSVGTAKAFDLEGCLALEPDLVVLPLKLEESADALAELGVPALVVNPEDQDLLNEAALLLGRATNTSGRAEALLAFAAAQEARLDEALAGLADADRPVVYLAGNSDFLRTAGEGMYQADLLRMAGAKNAAAGLTDSYWADVSYEQVLAWDPDVILLASDADYTVEEVLSDPALAGCKAVENGRVLQMPGDAEAWDSPVPGGILGAVWLASALHPEECPEAEAMEVIDSFYETFYDFSYSAG